MGDGVEGEGVVHGQQLAELALGGLAPPADLQHQLLGGAGGVGDGVAERVRDGAARQRVDMERAEGDVEGATGGAVCQEGDHAPQQARQQENDKHDPEHGRERKEREREHGGVRVGRRLAREGAHGGVAGGTGEGDTGGRQWRESGCGEHGERGLKHGCRPMWAREKRCGQAGIEGVFGCSQLCQARAELLLGGCACDGRAVSNLANHQAPPQTHAFAVPTPRTR